MLVFKLIETWAVTAKNRHNLPHEQDHEEIKWREPDSSCQHNLPNRVVVLSTTKLEGLKHLIAPGERRHEEEYVTLKVSLENNREEEPLHPLLAYLQVPHRSVEDEIVSVTKHNKRD